MKKKISEEIEIIEDKVNKKELVIGIKRKHSLLDNFALFFIGFGLLMFLFFIIDQGIDFLFIACASFSVFLFGSLAIQLYLAFNEKQIIEIHKDFIIIKKERPFLSKEAKIDRKNNSGFKFQKLGILPSGDIGFFVLLKHLTSFYDYPIPTIGNFIFFEHFNRQQREWIVKYLNNK